jgi:pimeloyl-ACP methyl ester carboxylesterase
MWPNGYAHLVRRAHERLSSIDSQPRNGGPLGLVRRRLEDRCSTRGVRPGQGTLRGRRLRSIEGAGASAPEGGGHAHQAPARSGSRAGAPHRRLNVDPPRALGPSTTWPCLHARSDPSGRQSDAAVHPVRGVPGTVRHADMDDLDEVRQALGYERINLYGSSYGGMAAQYYLRQHPDHVRTVVLDGVTLVDVPIFGPIRICAGSSRRFAQGSSGARPPPTSRPPAHPSRS